MKNDYLMQCCISEGLNETRLALDIKIWWNTIVAMLQSLQRIWPAVKKGLQEFSLSHLILNDTDIKLLESICDCLETVATGATAPCGNSLNLGEADKIIEFVLNKLAQDRSTFGPLIHEAILKRLSEQRRMRV